MDKELRRRILQISYERKLSHIGSCLSAVDIIDTIYDIKKSDEKFVLSSGHAHLAHAVILEKYGMGKAEDLLIAGIHCNRENKCDVSTGSLGQGLAIAIGLALADRDKNVYCLLSDGECMEGMIWESLRIASEQKLGNLKVWVNSNGWSAYGKIDQGLLERQLKEFFPVNFIKTNSDFGEARGLISHYKILNREEYERAVADK